MTSRKKYLHIKQIFETYADAENAISMAKYMRNQFVFYGIPTPRRKACCRGFLKAEKKNVSIDWDFLDLCYADDHREFQYFACDYLAAFQKILTFEDISQIRRYVRQKQWWDTIDCLDRIIGGIGLEDPRVDGVMLSGRWMRISGCGGWPSTTSSAGRSGPTRRFWSRSLSTTWAAANFS